MDQSDAADSAVTTSDAVAVLHLMGAELSSIAVTVPYVSELSHPTMKLLEASRSIHKAIVFLGDWSSSRDEELRHVVSM
jgi:maleate cis-trans isomerase